MLLLHPMNYDESELKSTYQIDESRDIPTSIDLKGRPSPSSRLPTCDASVRNSLDCNNAWNLDVVKHVETTGKVSKNFSTYMRVIVRCASTSIYSFDWAIFITWTGYDQDFFHLASLKLFVGLALEILKCKQSSLKPKPRCLQCCFRSKPTSGIPAKVWCEWIRPTKMHLYNPVAIAPLTAICRGARFFSKKSCCQLLSQDYQWHKPRVFHIILMPSTTGSDILLRGDLLWSFVWSYIWILNIIDSWAGELNLLQFLLHSVIKYIFKYYMSYLFKYMFQIFRRVASDIYGCFLKRVVPPFHTPKSSCFSRKKKTWVCWVFTHHFRNFSQIFLHFLRLENPNVVWEKSKKTPGHIAGAWSGALRGCTTRRNHHQHHHFVLSGKRHLFVGQMKWWSFWMICCCCGVRKDVSLFSPRFHDLFDDIFLFDILFDILCDP